MYKPCGPIVHDEVVNTVLHELVIKKKKITVVNEFLTLVTREELFITSETYIQLFSGTPIL